MRRKLSKNLQRNSDIGDEIMAKDYKILKLFIPILVTIYIILVSLVIGLIEEKVIAYWYHTLLVVVVQKIQFYLSKND